MRKAAYLQVTRECNNACVFCSNPQFEMDYTLAQAQSRVLEFKEAGVTEIIITGGEPTICSFIFDIIRFIREHNMVPRMITNGVKLEKGFVLKLKESGLSDVNISIHTSRPDIAEKLCKKPGHFEKSLHGLRNCIDSGLNVVLNSTINSLNVDTLPEAAKFFINKFPELNHYVYNNLDPGISDGNLNSRAGENSWVVARLIDIELPLKKLVHVLRTNGKTFRIERIPLCYMVGFEDASTETRKIVKDENYICSFIEKVGGSVIREVKPGLMRTKVQSCKSCMLNPICAGVQQEYLDIHGTEEIYPVFQNPDAITYRILPELKRYGIDEFHPI